jgi:hypothetical protein
METKDFAWALKRLKEGQKVCREGWNGKGMFIYMVGGTVVPRGALRNECERQVGPVAGANVKIGAHIDMKAADHSVVVGWLASQTDMLSDDWMIAE